MVLMQWICTKEECISLYLFDYWSVMHFFAGIAIFAVAFLIACKVKICGPSNSANNPPFGIYLFCFLSTLVLAFFWEIFENTVVIWIGLKDWPDSFINATMDIILVVLGGLYAGGLTYLLFNKKDYRLVYLFYGGMHLALWLIIYFILMFITNLNL